MYYPLSIISDGLFGFAEGTFDDWLKTKHNFVRVAPAATQSPDLFEKPKNEKIVVESLEAPVLSIIRKRSF